MAYVKIDGFLCERCSHRWVAKQPGLPDPKVCPKCKKLPLEHAPDAAAQSRPVPERPGPALARKASEQSRLR